jgi:hypothetical protein
MSKPTRGERAQEEGAPEDDHASGLTRRTVLAGVAATTAVVTVGVDTPAVAQGANPDSDMATFVQFIRGTHWDSSREARTRHRLHRDQARLFQVDQHERADSIRVTAENRQG